MPSTLDSIQEIYIKSSGNIKEGSAKVSHAINNAASIVNFNIALASDAVDNSLHDPDSMARSIKNDAKSRINRQVDDYFSLIEEKISEVTEKVGVQNPVVQALSSIADAVNSKNTKALSSLKSIMTQFYGFGGYALGSPYVDLSTPQQVWRMAVAKWEDVQTKSVVLFEDVKSQALFLYENSLDILSTTAIQIGEQQVQKITGLTVQQVLQMALKAWNLYKKYKLAIKQRQNEEENKEEPKTEEDKRIEKQKKIDQIKNQNQEEKKKKGAKEKKKKGIKSVKTSSYSIDVNLDALKAELISELLKLSDPLYNALLTFICIDEIKESIRAFKNISLNIDLKNLSQSMQALANIIMLIRQLGVSESYPSDFLKNININTFFNVFNNLTSEASLRRTLSLSSKTSFELDTAKFNEGVLVLKLYVDPSEVSASKKLQKLLENIDLWTENQIKYIMDNSKSLFSKWSKDKNSINSQEILTKNKTNELSIRVNIQCFDPLPAENIEGVNSQGLKDLQQKADSIENFDLKSQNLVDVKSINLNEKPSQILNKAAKQGKENIESAEKSIENDLHNVNLVKSVEDASAKAQDEADVQQLKDHASERVDNILNDLNSLTVENSEKSYIDPNKKTKLQAPFLTSVFGLLVNLEPVLSSLAVLVSNYVNNKRAALEISNTNIDAIKKELLDDLKENNHDVIKIDASLYNVYFIRTPKVKALMEEVLAQNFENKNEDSQKYKNIIESSIYKNKKTKLLNLDESSYFKFLLDEEGLDSSDIEEGFFTLLILEVDENNPEDLNGSSDGLSNIIWIKSENSYYIDNSVFSSNASEILENFFKRENHSGESIKEEENINDFSDLYVYTDEMEGEQVLSLNDVNLCPTEDVESTGLSESDVINNIKEVIDSQSNINIIVEIGRPTAEKPDFGKSFEFNKNLSSLNGESIIGSFVDSKGQTKNIKSIFTSGQIQKTKDNEFIHLYPQKALNRHVIIKNCGPLDPQSLIDNDKIDDLVEKFSSISILESFIIDNLNYSILPNILLRRKELKDGYVDGFGNFIYYAMEGYTGSEIYAKWKQHVDNTIENYHEYEGIKFSKKNVKKKGKELCKKQVEQIKKTKGQSSKLQKIVQDKLDKRENFLYGKHLISKEKNGIIDLYENYKDNPSALISGGVLSSDMEACKYTQTLDNKNQELGLADCYGLGVDYYVNLLEELNTLSGNSYVLEYYDILNNIIQKHNSFENIDESTIKNIIISEAKNLDFVNLSYKELINKLDDSFKDSDVNFNDVFEWIRKNVFNSTDEEEQNENAVQIQRVVNLYVYYRRMDKDFQIEKKVINGDGSFKDLSILDLIKEDKNILESFWSKVLSEFKTTLRLSKIIDELKSLGADDSTASWPEPVQLNLDGEVYQLYTFTEPTENIEDDEPEADEDPSAISTELPKNIDEFKPVMNFDINDLARPKMKNINSIYTLKYWKKYFSLATLLSLPTTAVGLVVFHTPIQLPAVFIPFTVIYQKQFNILIVIGLSIRGVFIDPIILRINTSSDFSSVLTPLVSAADSVYRTLSTKINLVELNIVTLAKIYKEQLQRENNNLNKEVEKLKVLRDELKSINPPTFKDVENEFKGYFSPVNQCIRRTTDLVNRTKMEFNQIVDDASTAINNLKDEFAVKESKEKEKELKSIIENVDSEVSSSLDGFSVLDSTSNNPSTNN